MTAAEVLKYAEKNGAKMVDFKFVDLLGIWQHTTMPIAKLAEDSFKEGFFFDGSSIRGWQPIHASDMIFIPDPNSAVKDPFLTTPTLSLTCDIVDAITKQPYPKDPRTIAAKAEAYLKSTGIGDTSYFGPEPEFFIFDSVTWNVDMSGSYVKITSEEAPWSSSADLEGGNMGHRPPIKGGYFPVPPVDSLQDIRSAMCLALEEMGVEVEVH